MKTLLKLTTVLSIVALTGCSAIWGPSSKPPMAGQGGDGYQTPCGQSPDNPCPDDSNLSN